jgi:serine/threonine protein phosphatase PrpC
MSDEQTQIKISGSTDTGLCRNYNQDFIDFDQNLGIAVLADGMGGHQAGEIAAQMAVNTVLENLQKMSGQKNKEPITDSQLLDYISNTISDSNTEICLASKADKRHKGMGATVVAAIVKESQVYVGHVGDSRLYLYRECILQRITKDHSLAQGLIDKGFYTETEAREANMGHLVTRSLGSKAEVEVDTVQHGLELHDILLLCSDGLTDMIPDWKIAEIITENADNLDRIANKLIDLANKHGGKDNISVILMQILK